ncbi:MAG TPA: nidogen-like domain-containing protein, partial [Gaiellaceae bacterium]
MIRSLLVALAALAAATLALAYAGSANAGAVAPSAGCTTNVLPPNDDGSTDAVALPFTLNFFGNSYGSLYVNNNGNVTFNGRMSTYTPFPIVSTGTPLIAPYFGDVDTRGAGSGVVTYGATTFGGNDAFCVM